MAELPKEPRMSEEELERVLEEYTKDMTPSFLRKRLRLSLYKKVQAGDISALDDLKKLEEYESKLVNAPAVSAAGPANAPSSSAALPAGEGGASPSGEEEIGIPERFRVKRRYNISDKVIEQRRNAARKDRPGSEGNRRNWRGGWHAQDFITGRIKPCKSTCPIFNECELVSEGFTKPDGVCLDKAAVIATYEALMQAINGKQDADYDDFNQVSALLLAETMHISRVMLEEVMDAGGVILRKKYDKNGVLQSEEYVPHPNLHSIPKLIADLNITPRELNATPRSRTDDKNAKEGNNTLAGIMSGLNRRQRDRQGAKDPEEDE